LSVNSPSLELSSEVCSRENEDHLHDSGGDSEKDGVEGSEAVRLGDELEKEEEEVRSARRSSLEGVLKQKRTLMKIAEPLTTSLATTQRKRMRP